MMEQYLLVRLQLFDCQGLDTFCEYLLSPRPMTIQEALDFVAQPFDEWDEKHGDAKMIVEMDQEQRAAIKVKGDWRNTWDELLEEWDTIGRYLIMAFPIPGTFVPQEMIDALPDRD